LYRVVFRRTLFRTLDELPRDLDVWMTAYNEYRPVAFAEEKHLSTEAQTH
jgi:hypothetical protein